MESRLETSAGERPPFLAGQEAYRAGVPIENNPHDEKIVYGDHYPGPWECWRHGWLHAQARREHDQRQNRTGG